MADKTSPVGVFDSGVGGISVLRSLVSLMPDEDYIYIGDSLNAPYGVKTADEVVELSEISLNKLLSMGAKQVIIACNTATAVAADTLRDKYNDIRIIGIEPAVKPAALENKGGKIAILATDLTVHQKRIAALYHKYEDFANIELVPCAGLVELIEGGHLYDGILFSYLEEKLQNLKGCDAYVLGCTHYPLIKDAFRHILGNVKFYDGGEGTARRSEDLLNTDNLRRNENSRQGSVEIINTSGDPRLVGFSYELLRK